MSFYCKHGVGKPVFRLAFCCLLMGLALLGGCGKTPHSAEHAEVTGKVLFEGHPLPGGLVTFVTLKGGFASTGNIDDNGNYQIKAPVGEVEISVTNRMLMAAGGPKTPLAPKRAEAKGGQAPKGRYVKIPSQYEDAHTSGLKYTVKPGPQTHDIQLSANPSAAPTAPGS